MRRWLLGLILLTLAPLPVMAQSYTPGVRVNGSTYQFFRPIRLTDGTAAAPSLTFASDTNSGMFSVSGDILGWSTGGNETMRLDTTRMILATAHTLGWTDVEFARVAAGIGKIANVANTDGALILGPATTSGVRLDNDGGEFSIIEGDGSAFVALNALRVRATTSQVTAGSGTGVTIDNAGELREQVYKVTIAETAFVCAATTCDVTVATLPAKTQITNVFADLTQTFACSATCTSTTLSMIFGRGAGGAEWLASFDADAAAAQFGDADAELGTTMTRAAAIQGGSFEAWASTQAAVLRLISGTGNIGDGAANFLSQGSVTLYLSTRVAP